MEEYDLDLRIKRPENETDAEWNARIERIRRVIEGKDGFGTTGWARLLLGRVGTSHLESSPCRIAEE